MASLKESSVIEKLNSSNYASWSFKMQMLLTKEDLIDAITETPPNPITNEWTKRDRKAKAYICLCINDDQIVHIKSKETAKEVWSTLKNLHERSTLSSKLYLLRNMYSCKLKEHGNMVQHITKILEFKDKLHAIGEDIKDSHLSALLLCSLPQSYETLITALEARPEEELTPQFIQSKLTDEYNRRLGSNVQSEESPQKAYKLNRNQSNTNNYKKSNKYCANCKMSNHTNNECWYNKNKNSYKKSNFSRRDTNYKKNNSSLCFESRPKQTDNYVHENRRNHDNQMSRNDKYENEVKNTTSKFNNLAFTVSNTKEKSKSWIVDSGSSSHIANNPEIFTNIKDSKKSEVIIANGKSLTSYGSGEVEIKTITANGNLNKITLQNVLYVPDIETNLLSVNKAAKNGCTVIFNDNYCEIQHEGKTYVEAQIKNDLYEVQTYDTHTSNLVKNTKDCKKTNCLDLWHRRLGHRNHNSIKELVSKELAIGIEIDKCEHSDLCENCIESKLTNAPYPKVSQNRTTDTLELIHSDICGPMPTQTIGGKRYFLTLIDDFSRYTVIYLLSRKSEAIDKIKEYVAMVSNKFGKIPQNLRSDNGGEYTSIELENFLKQKGVNHQFTIVNSPSQNGVAERKNRSLIEMTRALLNEANLPNAFWGEGINTANYLQNRLTTKINDVTPFQLWTTKPPDLSNTKIFGCKAYVYVDKNKRNKLENRAEPGIFVGYDNRTKGYRIYTEGKNIIIARTVKFIEDNFPYKKNETKTNDFLETNTVEENNSKTDEKLVEIEINNESKNEQLTQPNQEINYPRRSDRTNKGVPPDRYVYITQNKMIDEPTSWADLENIEDPSEKQKWLEATKEEINSLNKNKTWTLVELPPGKKAIGSRWTFKAKYNNEGSVEKYKARLVAKGYSQKFGEEFYETYAPVVSYTTIRSFLAMAAHKNLTINHIDVKTAFLHGDLQEDIYMKQPDGYLKPGDEAKVCKLNKAIYGLKQAARAWHQKIANTLIQLGFIQSSAEQCLFKRNKNEEPTYIVVYVDDILIAGNEISIREIVKELEKEYEIKNLGDINYYLGINIRKREDGSYALSQKMKINELVKKFNLEDAKPCSTPIEAGYLKTEENINLLPNNHNYRKAIGTLLYLATITRPDICASVNILSRRNENPRKRDWEQVKRTIRYLNTTKDLELIISPTSEPILKALADSDWGSDKTDRKSTTGNLFILGQTPIQWITKKQTGVALSSAEAEYISAAQAAQEILWMIKLLEDLDLPQKLPITICEDNQSCIKMIEASKNTNRTKHIDIKYHSVKHLKETGIIELKYCPTKEMTADCLTKPLPKPDFQKHRLKLQLCDSRRSDIKGQC